MFQAPVENNIVSNWRGEVTQFGGTTNYSCSSDTIFFEHDRELEFYEIECKPDGSFKEPEEWPRCVASMTVIFEKLMSMNFKITLIF